MVACQKCSTRNPQNPTEFTNNLAENLSNALGRRGGGFINELSSRILTEVRFPLEPRSDAIEKSKRATWSGPKGVFGSARVIWVPDHSSGPSLS